MSKVAILKIESAIGNKDPWLALWGLEDDTFTASDCSTFIEDNKDVDTIEIEISSDGGNVDVAFECYDRLTTWAAEKKGRQIVTKGYRVNSAATIIFLAAEPERRYISNNVQFVIHNPYVMDLYGAWTADDLLKLEGWVRESEDKMYNFYIDRTGIEESRHEDLKALMKEDTDLGREKAIEFGFASGTISGAVNKEASLGKRRALAYNNNMSTYIAASIKNNYITMSKENNSLLSKISDGITALLKQNKIKGEGAGEGTGSEEVKASSEKLKDGSALYFEGELAKDTVVFSDEAMTTKATAGDYELEDGRVVVVGEEGVVSEIKEAPAQEDAEAAKKDEEIKNLKASLDKSEKQNKVLSDGLLALQKDFEEFKKTVPGENDPKGTGGEGTGVKAEKPSGVGSVMAKIRKKNNQ